MGNTAKASWGGLCTPQHDALRGLPGVKSQPTATPSGLLRRAIQARCLVCVGTGPVLNRRTVREIRECLFDGRQGDACQLYPFRRGRAKQGSGSRRQAIRKYCLWCCNGSQGEVRHCAAKGCPLWPLRYGWKRKEVGNDAI